MRESYATAIRDASDILTQAVLDHEPDLVSAVKTLDRLLRLILFQIGRRVFERVLAAVSQEVVQAAKQEGLRIHRRITVLFFGLFGPVAVDSPYLYDPIRRVGGRPVKDRLGITDHGRTQALERAMTDFGAEESYGQGAARFEEHYGWSVNREAIRRVTLRQAKRAETYVQSVLDAASTALERPLSERPGVDQMLVELDGSMIRTGVMERVGGAETTPVRGCPRACRNEDWREVRVGLARPLESEKPPTYVAQMAAYPDVVSSLLGAAVSQGLSLRTETIAVADGGNGLKEELALQFPNLTFILDRPHLRSHLYETAEAMGLKEEDRSEWVNRRNQQIDEGKVSQVTAELRSHRGKGRKRVRRLVGYLTRFRNSVHYDDYKARGLPIGSGEVESAHRYIPQKRLKLPGACWHPESVNPMLALRVLRKNGLWNPFWTGKSTAYAVTNYL